MKMTRIHAKGGFDYFMGKNLHKEALGVIGAWAHEFDYPHKLHTALHKFNPAYLDYRFMVFMGLLKGDRKNVDYFEKLDRRVSLSERRG